MESMSTPISFADIMRAWLGQYCHACGRGGFQADGKPWQTPTVSHKNQTKRSNHVSQQGPPPRHRFTTSHHHQSSSHISHHRDENNNHLGEENDSRKQSQDQKPSRCENSHAANEYNPPLLSKEMQAFLDFSQGSIKKPDQQQAMPNSQEKKSTNSQDHEKRKRNQEKEENQNDVVPPSSKRSNSLLQQYQDRFAQQKKLSEATPSSSSSSREPTARKEQHKSNLPQKSSAASSYDSPSTATRTNQEKTKPVVRDGIDHCREVLLQSIAKNNANKALKQGNREPAFPKEKIPSPTDFEKEFNDELF